MLNIDISQAADVIITNKFIPMKPMKFLRLTLLLVQWKKLKDKIYMGQRLMMKLTKHKSFLLSLYYSGEDYFFSICIVCFQYYSTKLFKMVWSLSYNHKIHIPGTLSSMICLQIACMFHLCLFGQISLTKR